MVGALSYPRIRNLPMPGFAKTVHQAPKSVCQHRTNAAVLMDFAKLSLASLCC